MLVTVLGSGSEGNATLVECGGVRLLVDAGFSGRGLERRLRAAEVHPESINAIVVTHDHTDHTRGMGVLARRFGIPLYLTAITAAVCARLLDGSEDVRRYGSTAPLRIGPLEVRPCLTSHDAADPVALTVTDPASGEKLGIATDLGRPTAAVRHAFADCHLLVLESNHDEVMLREGPYPWSVKHRIASSHGHLSNTAAARFARELNHSELAGVVLAHLSTRCNHPGLAREVVGTALENAGFGGRMEVAAQDAPLEPLRISELRRRTARPQLPLL